MPEQPHEHANGREVEEKPRRRKFTGEYKREILRRADACKAVGELGAVLRSDGLYSSHPATWGKRDAGELAGLTPRNRGSPRPVSPPAGPEGDSPRSRFMHVDRAMQATDKPRASISASTARFESGPTRYRLVRRRYATHDPSPARRLQRGDDGDQPLTFLISAVRAGMACSQLATRP